MLIELNSHVYQTAVERTLRAITRFYRDCKKQKPGKKRFPKFKKHSRSVESNVLGWKLDESTKKHITFTDQKGIRRLKLVGFRDTQYYQPEQMKRVRIVKRTDGYSVQFSIKLDPKDTVKPLTPTQQAVGIDVGLKFSLLIIRGILR